MKYSLYHPSGKHIAQVDINNQSNLAKLLDLLRLGYDTTRL